MRLWFNADFDDNDDDNADADADADAAAADDDDDDDDADDGNNNDENDGNNDNVDYDDDGGGGAGNHSSSEAIKWNRSRERVNSGIKNSLVYNSWFIHNTFPFITPWTVCRSDQFMCRNGRCINDDYRCDENFDCMGGEDEANCRKLTHVLLEGLRICVIEMFKYLYWLGPGWLVNAHCIKKKQNVNNKK